jgi:hypothetical protein
VARPRRSGGSHLYPGSRPTLIPQRGPAAHRWGLLVFLVSLLWHTSSAFAQATLTPATLLSGSPPVSAAFPRQAQPANADLNTQDLRGVPRLPFRGWRRPGTPNGFVYTGSLKTARYSHTATLLNNGTVLIVGGLDVNGTLATAEIYNSATGTFSATGSLNIARCYHTATLLNNGMVLIAGGNSEGPGGPAYASAELYDPATGVFTLTGSMNTGRYYHTATLLNNGMVLMAGGVGLDSTYMTLSSVELYDPATGTFSYTGSLNTDRESHTATLLNDGTVLIAGGYGYLSSGWGNLTSAELYSPATETFTYTGSLNTDRDFHTATLKNDGTVLIAGGYGGVLPSYAYLASAELYSPTTETFTYTGSLNTGRGYHAGAELSNGMVLIAGGIALLPSYSYLVSAELYNAATGVFTLTGSLNAARAFHTATLLNDGMVLMAGGLSTDAEIGTANVLASAELYEPATLTPPDLVSIAVAPSKPTLPPGATRQFIATGTFSDGSMEQLASVTWASSDATLAQISNDASNHGVALAIAAGPVTITATAGGISGYATLTITP